MSTQAFDSNHGLRERSPHGLRESSWLRYSSRVYKTSTDQNHQNPPKTASNKQENKQTDKTYRKIRQIDRQTDRKNKQA